MCSNGLRTTKVELYAQPLTLKYGLSRQNQGNRSYIDTQHSNFGKYGTRFGLTAILRLVRVLSVLRELDGDALGRDAYLALHSVVGCNVGQMEEQPCANVGGDLCGDGAECGTARGHGSVAGWEGVGDERWC